MYPLNGGVAVALKCWLDVAEWEGGNLFHSDNDDVFNSTLCPLRLKIVVDLTTAEENLLNLVVWDKISCGLLNDSLESEADFKLGELGASTTEFQKFLRDGHNQWLPERPSNLSSKQMEVLCSGGAVTQSEVHSFGNL